MSIIFLKFRAGYPDSVSGRDDTFINMYKKNRVSSNVSNFMKVLLNYVMLGKD